MSKTIFAVNVPFCLPLFSVASPGIGVMTVMYMYPEASIPRGAEGAIVPQYLNTIIYPVKLAPPPPKKFGLTSLYVSHLVAVFGFTDGNGR